MTKKYTDFGVVYELREKKKCKGGDRETVFFSLMAIRFVSSNNLLLLLRDRYTTHELVVPCKTGRDKDGNDILSVATHQLLSDYIEQKKTNPPVDHSKIRLAGKFVKTLEASLKLFPPIDKVDVSPSGRETVYYFQRIA